MFFEQESFPFEIVNVFFFDQRNTRNRNFNRKYDALSFRLEGEAVLEGDNTYAEVSEGALTYVPAELDYVRTAAKDKFLVVDFVSYGAKNKEIEFFYPQDRGKYKNLFERIYKIWSDKKTGYRHKAASVLSEILCETYRDKKPEQFSDVRIYPSVKYIDEHCFSQDLSLCKAAEVSFVSEVYFRKLFKREFGISPKKYVINKRIEYAVSLLEAGYHSLKEIAYMCGYSDYKYFSVEFKKATGRSPSEYVL